MVKTTKCFWGVASLLLLITVSSQCTRATAFAPGARGPRNFEFRNGAGRGSSSSTTARHASESSSTRAPVLVVGATGRVGRKVVQQLLAQDRPVRALVRDPKKAQQIFGAATTLPFPKLDIVVVDMSRYEDYDSELEKAVKGCDSIISVMGVVRVSQFADFLPWRLFGSDVSSWAGRDHPYYGNFLGQKRLIELAAEHKIKRFVRLTGLGLAYSAFNPFAILFNTLLSGNNRYGILCEQALAKSNVPYVVLRPGGLANNARNTTTTNLQVDASGKLPFPGRVGRSDVAALAVAATEPGVLPDNKSFTLACRWVGENIKPKPQGLKSDGLPTAVECLKSVGDSDPMRPVRMKPYSLAVALTVYSLTAVAFKVLSAFWALTKKLIRG